MSGGKRENCGAKPKPATRKHQYSCRLPQPTIAFLKAESERVCKSQAQLIDEALVAQYNLAGFKVK